MNAGGRDGGGGARRGTFVLVVGPSGAGKDSIIEGARAALEGKGGFVFPRRYITRAAAAGGEAHVALTPEVFAHRREAGDFLLEWHAHGLDYALPQAIAAELAAGRTVIANVSRSVIEAARARFQPLIVAAVTAPDTVLSARIRARGREAAGDVAARLERARTDRPSGADVITIVNDGPLARAVEAFVALLRHTRRTKP